MEPASAIAHGREFLDPILEPHGFTFEASHIGRGSGGPFATAFYVKDKRRLELHFRWSLGLVAYHFEQLRVSHADYMWSVLGPQGGNTYPGFSDDPLQGFRDLAEDLRDHASEFVSGTDLALESRLKEALTHPKPTGLNGIPGIGAV